MDNYVKIKVLGKGSFGSATLIKRKADGQLFVVKEVNLQRMNSKEREDARHEVKVLQQLHHPNITQFVEHIERKDKMLYIVMEFADGGDLHKKLEEHAAYAAAKGRAGQGGLKESAMMHYFSQLCLALDYLHTRHILHRDIKTMNIFLTTNGTVKLGDFGISTVLRNTMGLANTVCGTPYYFSPELCRNKPYNNKSDVWALGIVLYELATCRHAFDGNSMHQLMQRIVKGAYAPLPTTFTAELRNLVTLCLQKDPARRPSIKQILVMPIVRQALERLQGDLLSATIHNAPLPSFFKAPPHPPVPAAPLQLQQQQQQQQQQPAAGNGRNAAAAAGAAAAAKLGMGPAAVPRAAPPAPTPTPQAQARPLAAAPVPSQPQQQQPMPPVGRNAAAPVPPAIAAMDPINRFIAHLGKPDAQLQAEAMKLAEARRLKSEEDARDRQRQQEGKEREARAAAAEARARVEAHAAELRRIMGAHDARQKQNEARAKELREVQQQQLQQYQQRRHVNPAVEAPVFAPAPLAPPAPAAAAVKRPASPKAPPPPQPSARRRVLAANDPSNRELVAIPDAKNNNNNNRGSNHDLAAAAAQRRNGVPEPSKGMGAPPPPPPAMGVVAAVAPKDVGVFRWAAGQKQMPPPLPQQPAAPPQQQHRNRPVARSAQSSPLPAPPMLPPANVVAAAQAAAQAAGVGLGGNNNNNNNNNKELPNGPGVGLAGGAAGGRGHDWGAREGDRKRRALEEALADDRRQVMAMDEQVLRAQCGLRARVVDPSLEAWLENRKGPNGAARGQGDAAAAGAAAALAFLPSPVVSPKHNPQQQPGTNLQRSPEALRKSIEAADAVMREHRAPGAQHLPRRQLPEPMAQPEAHPRQRRATDGQVLAPRGTEVLEPVVVGGSGGAALPAGRQRGFSNDATPAVGRDRRPPPLLAPLGANPLGNGAGQRSSSPVGHQVLTAPPSPFAANSKLHRSFSEVADPELRQALERHAGGAPGAAPAALAARDRHPQTVQPHVNGNANKKNNNAHAHNNNNNKNAPSMGLRSNSDPPPLQHQPRRGVPVSVSGAPHTHQQEPQPPAQGAPPMRLWERRTQHAAVPTAPSVPEQQQRNLRGGGAPGGAPQAFRGVAPMARGANVDALVFAAFQEPQPLTQPQRPGVRSAVVADGDEVELEAVTEFSDAPTPAKVRDWMYDTPTREASELRASQARWPRSGSGGGGGAGSASGSGSRGNDNGDDEQSDSGGEIEDDSGAEVFDADDAAAAAAAAAGSEPESEFDEIEDPTFGDGTDGTDSDDDAVSAAAAAAAVPPEIVEQRRANEFNAMCGHISHLLNAGKPQRRPVVGAGGRGPGPVAVAAGGGHAAALAVGAAAYAAVGSADSLDNDAGPVDDDDDADAEEIDDDADFADAQPLSPQAMPVVLSDDDAGVDEDEDEGDDIGGESSAGTVLRLLAARCGDGFAGAVPCRTGGAPLFPPAPAGAGPGGSPTPHQQHSSEMLRAHLEVALGADTVARLYRAVFALLERRLPSRALREELEVLARTARASIALAIDAADGAGGCSADDDAYAAECVGLLFQLVYFDEETNTTLHAAGSAAASSGDGRQSAASGASGSSGGGVALRGVAVAH